MRYYLKKYFIKWYVNRLKNSKFCIFSNDCWAGEIYKLSKRQFNTPFINLMIMAPCYLKLLENPKTFLSYPLIFIPQSRYAEMNKINSGKAFPLATLGESGIEIHFLHYKNAEDAAKAWERRVKRIDWENVFVKFDCGKDYGDEEIANNILNLPYKKIMIFGSGNYLNEKIISVRKYSNNAVTQFYNCFAEFNPFIWVKYGNIKAENLLEKTFRKFLFK